MLATTSNARPPDSHRWGILSVDESPIIRRSGCGRSPQCHWHEHWHECSLKSVRRASMYILHAVTLDRDHWSAGALMSLGPLLLARDSGPLSKVLVWQLCGKALVASRSQVTQLSIPTKVGVWFLQLMGALEPQATNAPDSPDPAGPARRQRLGRRRTSVASIGVILGLGGPLEGAAHQAACHSARRRRGA
jgi:hypothetical protein